MNLTTKIKKTRKEIVLGSGTYNPMLICICTCLLTQDPEFTAHFCTRSLWSKCPLEAPVPWNRLRHWRFSDMMSLKSRKSFGNRETQALGQDNRTVRSTAGRAHSQCWSYFLDLLLHLLQGSGWSVFLFRQKFQPSWWFQTMWKYYANRKSSPNSVENRKYLPSNCFRTKEFGAKLPGGNLYEHTGSQNGKTKPYEDFGLLGTLVRVDAILFSTRSFFVFCHPSSILSRPSPLVLGIWWSLNSLFCYSRTGLSTRNQ